MRLEIHIGCALAAALVVAVFAQECRGAVPLNQYIDYIQTDGSQKVVLDYVPNSNTVVEVKVDVASTTKNHCIFCARANSNNLRTYSFFMLKGTDGWRFDYCNNNSNKSKSVPSPGTPVVLKTTCEGLYVDGVKKTTYTLQDFTAQNKMALFFSYNADPGAADSVIVNGNNANNEAAMKVYYIKIWDDNGATLRYDLRPYRDASLVNCLRDEVSGENIYPYSSTTPFGGPEVVWWEPAIDDPAVFEEAATYPNGFRGTGSNVAVFRGATKKTFTGSCTLSDFASVRIEDGQVWGQKNGQDLFSGDISLETARLVMDAPSTETDAAWTMYAATNGTLRFGADAAIGVHHIKHTSAYASTLRLGRIVRDDPGGTLLFSARCNNANYFGYSYLGSKCRVFPSGFSDGETLPAYMVGGFWGTTSYTAPMTFLKYTSADGVVPADTTAFADAGLGDVALVSADTVMDADRHVKALQFGANCDLEIPEGKTLTLGNGTDPTGVVLYPRGVATNFVSGAGTIDFCTAQGIFWIGNHNSRSTVSFGDVAISGSGGVIFADRHATTRSSIYALYAANWHWTGPTYVDSCILGMMDAAQTEIDGDIYVRGNSMGGAGLYHKAEAGGSKTFNFNGHLYLTGPSDQGLSDSQYAYSTFFASKAWSDNRTINFKGGVTVRHNVQFQSSYNANNSNRGHFKCTMNFDSPIDGDGSIHFPYNTLDAYFNKANTYSGATHIAHDTRLYVVGEGTLGKGPVTVNLTVMHNGVYKEAMLTFKNKSDYAMDNLFSGNGTIALSNSSLVFSNDVSIGKLTFDANSSAVFGGAVSASTKLTFPAGAEMSALDGATPTLTVTNGTLFAGRLSNIDIVCDGIITNRGTLAVTRVGANKRLDPIVIDGDAVFENATFEISGLEGAMGGTHTILSVTGAVEGEPTFVFPEGKAYDVVRTDNAWSINKPVGFILFVR